MTISIIHFQQEPFIQYVSDKRPMSGGSLERPRSCAPDEPVRLNTGQLVEGYCIDLLKMLKQVKNIGEEKRTINLFFY